MGLVWFGGWWVLSPLKKLSRINDTFTGLWAPSHDATTPFFITYIFVGFVHIFFFYCLSLHHSFAVIPCFSQPHLSPWLPRSIVWAKNSLGRQLWRGQLRLLYSIRKLIGIFKFAKRIQEVSLCDQLHFLKKQDLSDNSPSKIQLRVLNGFRCNCVQSCVCEVLCILLYHFILDKAISMQFG